MKVQINFEVHEHETEYLLRQCLRKIGAQLKRDPATACDALEADDVLKDLNGNTVGTVKVEA